MQEGKAEMGDIVTAFNALKDTSIPAILAVAGLFFILLAFAGKIAGKIELPPQRQKWVGVLGFLFLFLGILLAIVPAPTEVPTSTTVASAIVNTPTVVAASETDTPVAQPTATVPPVPTNAGELSLISNAEAQIVRWGPSMQPAREAGICINNCADFVLWDQLKGEIEQKLLPQVPKVQKDSTVTLGDWNGNQDWIVQVVSPDGREIAHIWFGPDPSDINWRTFDGLVRVGYPSVPADVWCTFQRYSDKSYRKLKCD
jgi:hypothetical protein